jgi:hypothetical protein
MMMTRMAVVFDDVMLLLSYLLPCACLTAAALRYYSLSSPVNVLRHSPSRTIAPPPYIAYNC